ncbi:hypothetical protein POSPLADRAFT_1148743 [Postia placenta MAD-698-R-SB12]|uniref:Nuclear segregation protein Bfr1 n=1 Tax=Postia placenta MAD-698-R-SB12 TaxID=670580 RepID=A0A1X6MVL7_9APHY|nr:hypothetical protein POSPLADRAFT_1148743 [Postia placenta MAD-698-R-SB12]OSX60401.1 hypothetical protein POSPLADRAFT_1148743 [Postia placenta MAD-698-R-SB12]
MAAGKSKTATTNGAGKKPKVSTSSGNGNAAPNGKASPVTPTAVEAISEQFDFAAYVTGKPEKSVYDQEQEKIKAQIDALQSAVKEKLGLTSKGDAGNDKRAALRAELDSLRGQQSNTKLNRSKVFDQLKAIQDGVQKKVKDLNAAKAKAPYKTVDDVDDRIKQLDKQVESGNLKLGDEKRALAEISQLRRSRRLVEGFQAEQESIEADRAAADALRQQLDDPEAKAVSERYDAIKAELDELKKEGDEAFANRSKLLDERTALQNQLDTLYNRKRESAQRFREANDRYWNKMNEERARRAERQRAQRVADEEAKKRELAERLRDEAEVPAFQLQIEDCQTLIDQFSGRNPTQALSSALSEKADVTGVPKLEIRKVEADSGMVVRKKKGEDDDNYFVATPRKQKGKKGGAKASGPSEVNGADASASQTLHVPLPTLSALLSLSIAPPTSPADVPRVIEDLKAKKAWFVSNQARVTAENKEKAEARIRQLTGAGKTVDAPVAEDLTPPNGGGEHPAEPVSTPAITDVSPAVVPSEAVEEKLESVAEEQNGDADVAE